MKDSKPYAYMKYAGMATQLLVMMLIGVWLGGKADAYFGFEKPWATIALVFIFLAGWFTRLYYDLVK
jgi:uncharacterized membrane protein YdbT with pleckstrin-like domain